MRAPTLVAAARGTKMGMASRFETLCEAALGCQLVGQGLILNKAVVTSRTDGLLVQPQGVRVPPFEAGDLSRHQRQFVAKCRRTIVGPLAQLFAMCDQDRHPCLLLLVRGRLIKCR